MTYAEAVKTIAFHAMGVWSSDDSYKNLTPSEAWLLFLEKELSFDNICKLIREAREDEYRSRQVEPEVSR